MLSRYRMRFHLTNIALECMRVKIVLTIICSAKKNTNCHISLLNCSLVVEAPPSKVLSTVSQLSAEV